MIPRQEKAIKRAVISDWLLVAGVSRDPIHYSPAPAIYVCPASF